MSSSRMPWFASRFRTTVVGAVDPAQPVGVGELGRGRRHRNVACPTARPSPRRSWSGPRRRRPARRRSPARAPAAAARAAAADRVGDEQLRLQVGRQHVADALLQAGREHRHEADQEDADHQRGGRHRRARRVALGVLARDAAGNAAPLHAGVADRAGQDRHHGRRCQRDPEQEQQGAGAERDQHRCRAVDDEQADGDDGETEDRDDGRDDLALAREPAGRQLRALADRRDGRDLRSTGTPARTMRPASRRCRSPSRR